MPLTFRSVGAAVEVASGNLTFTEPAGAAQGDLLVASICYRSTAAFTLPAGWAIVGTQQSSGNTTVAGTGSIASGLMAYIVRGASAPDLVFVRTAGDVALGRLSAYTPGAGETVTLNTGVAETLAAASVTVTATGFTTAEALELVVMAECNARNVASSRARATDPQEFIWRERADSGTATGADAALAVSDATKFAAGATGTFTYTAASSARHVCIVGAFKSSTWAGPKPSVLIDAGSTTTGNYTTPSFTPAANALLIVAHRTTFSSISACSISDSAGLSWTLIDEVTDTYESGASGTRLAAFWAVAGSSPPSMTVTATPDPAGAEVRSLAVIEVIGADTSSPVGAKVNNAHITDTQAVTLDATPAATSIVFEWLNTWDVSSATAASIGADRCLELTDTDSPSSSDSRLASQVRFGSTSTSMAWGDALPGTTIAAEDLSSVLAFEIKKAAAASTTPPLPTVVGQAVSRAAFW